MAAVKVVSARGASGDSTLANVFEMLVERLTNLEKGQEAIKKQLLFQALPTLKNEHAKVFHAALLDPDFDFVLEQSCRYRRTDHPEDGDDALRTFVHAHNNRDCNARLTFLFLFAGVLGVHVRDTIIHYVLDVAIERGGLDSQIAELHEFLATEYPQLDRPALAAHITDTLIKWGTNSPYIWEADRPSRYGVPELERSATSGYDIIEALADRCDRCTA